MNFHGRLVLKNKRYLQWQWLLGKNYLKAENVK